MPTMAATAIDTLRYARRLRDAGVPHEQAEAMADAIGSELTVQLVTKADLEAATAGLDAGIAKVESSVARLSADLDTSFSALAAANNERFSKIESSLATMRWMMGFILAFVVALTWRSFS